MKLQCRVVRESECGGGRESEVRKSLYIVLTIYLCHCTVENRNKCAFSGLIAIFIFSIFLNSVVILCIKKLFL